MGLPQAADYEASGVWRVLASYSIIWSFGRADPFSAAFIWFDAIFSFLFSFTTWPVTGGKNYSNSPPTEPPNQLLAQTPSRPASTRVLIDGNSRQFECGAYGCA